MDMGIPILTAWLEQLLPQARGPWPAGGYHYIYKRTAAPGPGTTEGGCTTRRSDLVQPPR